MSELPYYDWMHQRVPSKCYFFLQHYFQIAQHYQAMLQQASNATNTGSNTSQQQQPQQQQQQPQQQQQQQSNTTPVQQTIQIVQAPNGQVQALQVQSSLCANSSVRFLSYRAAMRTICAL